MKFSEKKIKSGQNLIRDTSIRPNICVSKSVPSFFLLNRRPIHIGIIFYLLSREVNASEQNIKRLVSSWTGKGRDPVLHKRKAIWYIGNPKLETYISAYVYL